MYKIVRLGALEMVRLTDVLDTLQEAEHELTKALLVDSRPDIVYILDLTTFKAFRTENDCAEHYV